MVALLLENALWNYVVRAALHVAGIDQRKYVRLSYIASELVHQQQQLQKDSIIRTFRKLESAIDLQYV